MSDKLDTDNFIKFEINLSTSIEDFENKSFKKYVHI